jgi:hypothetical protein
MLKSIACCGLPCDPTRGAGETSTLSPVSSYISCHVPGSLIRQLHLAAYSARLRRSLLHAGAALTFQMALPSLWWIVAPDKKVQLETLHLGDFTIDLASGQARYHEYACYGV